MIPLKSGEKNHTIDDFVYEIKEVLHAFISSWFHLLYVSSTKY